MVKMAVEVRFLAYVSGLYASFIYWGYIQEKLTSTKYSAGPENAVEVLWDYPIALNLLMASSAVIAAAFVESFSSVPTPKVPFVKYAKAAITCAIASPLGYASLKFISFPLMILAKSSKPVPVMLIGVLFYRKTYTWYKYISVLLLCGGICLFSFGKGGKAAAGSSDYSDILKQLFGIFLVGLNLSLDGYTNNEQDFIFKNYGVTSLQMMKYVNIWQSIYLFLFLFVGWLIYGETSELHNAVYALTNSSGIQIDVAWFCVCASVGQLLIFAVMEEFGSLVWITVSITRKLVTILFSVFMFNHTVKPLQWTGIAFAAVGMILEVLMGYVDKTAKKVDDKKYEKITVDEKVSAEKKKDVSNNKSDHNDNDKGVLPKSTVKKRVKKQ